MIENACELAKKRDFKKGDYVVITAGAPIGVSGSKITSCKIDSPCLL